jgi:DNA modification methylase
MTNHKIICSDARSALRILADNSVHCAVTSPPYFGPRKYSTPPQIWKDGWNGELGREPDPVMYANHLVEVFHELKRVLRPDGTFWLNIGDCHAKRNYKKYGIKRLEAIGIPWMIAFAMRQDGWYVDSDVIWNKLNAIPSGGTNRRCGDSKEYIFMFAKTANHYFDKEAIREPVKIRKTGKIKFGGTKYPKVMGGIYSGKEYVNTGYRCKRDVWTLPVYSTRDEHYAAYSVQLITPCIIAGTSEACCPKCGNPYKRVVELGRQNEEWMKQCGADSKLKYDGENQKDYKSVGAQSASDTKRNILEGMRERRTLGWTPTCECNAGKPIPCTVLDPFTGTGTTSLAAKNLGRSSIGIELKREYIDIIRRKIGTEDVVYL